MIRPLPFPQQGCLSVSVHLNLGKMENMAKIQWLAKRGSQLVAPAHRLAH